MKVTVIDEYGYLQALFGLGLSYGITSNFTFDMFVSNTEMIERYNDVAKKLCNKEGHNKFLESIVVYLDVDLPRYAHSQLDTYRAGMTKQSESTMHTLMKRELTQEDFETPIFENTLGRLNYLIREKRFEEAKNELPEGFLQRRVMCTNYKCLKHIVNQRKSHKLKQWTMFITALSEQLKHPELIGF